MVWYVGRWYGLVCGEVVWFGVWGGGMVWCVGRWYGLEEVVWFGGGGMVWYVGRWYGLVCGGWYGLVCVEVVWFGVWGGGMVWCVGRWYGVVCGEVVWFGV